MLFNIDRNTKNNLLQMYKKDAENHNFRKQADRQKKIMEEREYLQQYEQRENALEDRLRLEKVRKINANMDDYQKMLQTQTARHKSKIDDVKINGYGYNIAGGNPIINNSNLSRTYGPEQSHYQPQQSQPQIMQPQHQYQMNPIDNRDKRSFPPRESDMIRREDHMGNYLTDKQNEGELKSYFQNQKYEHMKYYKDLLDNQCSQRKNSPLTTNPNVRNANIINNQKRFNLANDPYNMKKNTGFGSSLLERNPITNPVNNLEYNKYMNFIKNDEQGQEKGKEQSIVGQNIGMMEQGRALPQQQQQQPQQWNDYPSNNDINSNQRNYFSSNQSFNDYQPLPVRDQYFPNSNDNNINNIYNDYSNPPQINNYQQQPYDYQDNRMPMQQQQQNQQLPYTLTNNIFPSQSLPSQPANGYQKEIIPTPTGQRLIAAGASSFLRP